MSEESQAAAAPQPAPEPPPRSPFAAALPYILTAVAAVVASLLIQNLLAPRPSQPFALAPTATQPATPAATAPSLGTAPASTPSPPVATSPAGDTGVLALQILDLEAQDRELKSAIYLLRAAIQLDDAVAALLVNDMAEADRTMLTAYSSLDRAYAFSAEQEKGPIDSFRLELSRIRDDMRVRPEGVDRRLRQLRQLMLSLLDEDE